MSVSLVKSDFKAILSLVPLQTTDSSISSKPASSASLAHTTLALLMNLLSVLLAINIHDRTVQKSFKLINLIL